MVAGSNEHGIELNLSAQSRLDQIQGELTTWERHIRSERGCGLKNGIIVDPIATSARFLADHVEWMRHRPEADEFLAAIDAASRLMTNLIDGAPPQVYLGPCGEPAQIEVTAFSDLPGRVFVDGQPCDGDVYARQHASVGRCRTCSAEVDADARRQWLDDEVRSRTFRAVHIADAYSINVNTIRSWYARGRLTAHGHEDGKPLFNVGDVLDLAAADAKRRAENEAKKARRDEKAA